MQHRSLDSLLMQFDRAVRTGTRSTIDEALDGLAPSEEREVLPELIAIEMQHGWLRGDGRTIDHYRKLYASRIPDPEFWEMLIEEELIARRRAGVDLMPDELQQRFGERAEEIDLLWHRVCQQYQPVIVGLDQRQSDFPDWVGQTIAGRFEILERIGQGAHADVFRAMDRTLHRAVAIKLARNPMPEGSEAARRFFREAESIARLQHPGIVSVHDFGRAGDRLFIAEEFVPNGTLEQRIASGPVSPQQAAAWMQEICSAMDYAHQCGVIHRDLKPANVLVDHAGRLKVGDFGLAVRSEGEVRLTHQGQVLGTPAYMSPEQVRGDAEITPATDVYALGAMLYHMLTGQLPFQGSTASVLTQILHHEPVPPRRLLGSVPRDMETICLVALAREPHRRYASARDLGEDLRRFLAHEPLRARRTGWIGQVTLWIRRQPLTAAVILGSALLIALVTVISFIRIARERNRFRAERDRANAALLESLISNSANELQVKSSGWYQRAGDYLKQAAGLVTSDGQRTGLRDAAVRWMLDPTPRLERISSFLTGNETGATGSEAAPAVGVTAMAMDPLDPRWLIAGNAAGRLVLCDVEQERVTELMQFASRISQVHVRAEDETLYVLTDGILTGYAIELNAGNESSVSRLADARVLADDVAVFAVHDATRTIACGLLDGRINLFRHGDQGLEELRQWKGHDDEPVSLDFSDDGVLLATSSLDRSLKCWETRTGEMVSTRVLVEPARSLSFSSTGKDMLWTSWETFTFYGAPIQGAIREFARMSSPFRAVAETTSRRTVSISTEGLLVLWNHDQQLASVRAPCEMSCLIAAPGLERIGVGLSSGEVQLFRIAGTELNRPFSTRHAIDIDSAGRLFDEYGMLDAEGPTRRLAEFAWNQATALLAGRVSDIVIMTNHRGQVQVVKEGQPQPIPGPVAGNVVKVAMGNHDSWLAISQDTGQVKVIDLETLEVVREYAIDFGPVLEMALQPDGEGLAVAGKAGTFLFLPGSPPRALNPHVQFDAALAWTTGAIACSMSDGRIAIHRPGDSEPPVVLASHDPLVRDLAFSPDGSTLFATYENRDVVSWDWRVGQVLHRRSLDRVHHALSVDPQGDLLVLHTHWGRPKVVHQRTLRPRGQLAHGPSWSHFSHDGERLWIADQGLSFYSRADLAPLMRTAAGGHADEPAEVILDVAPGRILSGGHRDIVWSVDLSPDDQWMATGSFDNDVKIWQLSTGSLVRELRQHRAMVWRVCFSPDGQYLATGSADPDRDLGEAILWRTADWSIASRLSIGTRLVGAMDFHPRLPWLALATFDGTIALVKYPGLDIVHRAQPFRHPILDVAFQPNGEILAGACLSDGVGLWRMSEGERPADYPLQSPRFLKEGTERVWAVAFSHDQKLLAAGCESGAIILYDTATWKRLAALPTGRPRLRYLRFSPDDSRLYGSAYTGDGCLIELGKLRRALGQLGLGWQAPARSP